MAARRWPRSSRRSIRGARAASARPHERGCWRSTRTCIGPSRSRRSCREHRRDDVRARCRTPRSNAMRIVILGLSVTSSWGNGHATNYRGLMSALAARGHDVLFLERDVPWYAAQRDLPDPPWGTTRLYDSVDELQDRHAQEVRAADLVVVGS